MSCLDQSQGHLFSDVVIVRVKVFGSLVKSRVGAQVHIRQVITEKQCGVRLRYSKITK